VLDDGPLTGPQLERSSLHLGRETLFHLRYLLSKREPIMMNDQAKSGLSWDGESEGCGSSRGSMMWCRGLMGRFRWVLLLVFAVVLFSLGRHAGAVQKEQEILRAKSIETERFELRSPDGKLAALLTTGPAGETLLSFHDQNGVPGLTMGIDSHGAPAISFYGEKHDLKMSLSLDPAAHTPSARMFDGRGELQISMSLDDRLGPSISVGRPDKTHISIGVSNEKGPSVTFSDEKNNSRMVLSVLDKESVISLLDENRVVRAQWRVVGDGSPSFLLTDRASRVRLWLSTDADGKSSIRFLDANGKMTKEIAE
jgi:hypothetical protein